MGYRYQRCIIRGFGFWTVQVANLKIDLFGEFRVRRGENLIKSEEWDRQKTRSLLKLLLTRSGHAFSRDEIIEALWPDAPPAAAERSLWVTVSLLRRALEPNLERRSDSRYILQRRPGYTFNREADCEVDAWEFEKHQQMAEAAQKAGSLDEAIREYRLALELWRGEFLAEEPYEDWAMEIREEWHKRQLSVLSELAECLALKGRYTEAIEDCDRALALDGYREDLHRRLMLYHYCAGEQGLALRTYRGYATLLKEELGAAPSPELERLKKQIEARDVPGVDALRRYPRPRRHLRYPYSLSRTHFAGRDREYALLAARLEDAMEGSGGAVAVEGEAGVGKTRLIEEFVGYARSRGVRVLSGRCYERELGSPLEPVMEALETLPTMNESASKTAGFKLDYRRAAVPEEATLIYRALSDELVRESRHDRHEGLVLFIDDVQWADPATLDFLAYLAKRASGERILVTFSYRREDGTGLSGWIDHLAERRALSTVSLERLSREDIAEILGRMSSEAFGQSAQLAEFLHGESEGNPFYAVEYLRWLIEAEITLIDSRRRICGLESEALREGTMPSGVRSLIRARLADVGSETRALLELAAVIGRTFDLKLLCTAATCEEAEAFTLMRPMIASGFIVETAEGEAYYFSHDKFRQALYEGIENRRLRELHLQVAKALPGVSSEPAELAHHYLRARAWRPALEYLVLAARRAEESYAWQTALSAYTRALEVADKLPNSEEKRLDLLGARDRLLEHLNRLEERAATVDEMFELASRLGDHSRLAGVYVRRIGVLAALSDLAAAEEARRLAVSQFRGLGDEAGEARAHREMAYVLWAKRDGSGSLQANFLALHLHRKLGDRRGQAGDLGNIAEVYRGMGDDAQALRWANEAIQIYRELGDKLGEAMRLATVAAIHRERGHKETALRLILRTLQLYTELGAKNLLVAQHSACGTLYLGLGAPNDALKHFQAAARLSREIGYTKDEGYSLMSVGVSLEHIKDFAGAADAYRRALGLLEIAYELSGTSEELSGKAEALSLLAKLLHRSLNQPVEALNAYEAAAKIYRDFGDMERLCKVLMGLAGLRWRTGSTEGSARNYEEALLLAREQRDTPHESAALMSLSVVYRDLGRLKESLKCGREACALLRKLGDLQAEAYALSSLAESYARLGYHPSALSCLRRSLRLRHKVGDREGEVGVLYDLAKVYENMGDMSHAKNARTEAEQMSRARGDARDLSFTERSS